MGRTAIVAAIAALVGMPAFAADMAVKAPPSPPPAPVYQWAGFYIGGNVGGTWNDNSVNLVSHGHRKSRYS